MSSRVSMSSSGREYIESGSCTVLIRESIEENEGIPNAPPPTPVLKAATPVSPVIAPQQLDEDGINGMPGHAAAANGAPVVEQSLEVITDADAIVNASVAGPSDLYTPAWTHDNGIRSGGPSPEEALRPNSPSKGEKENANLPGYNAPYYPPRNSATISAWERYPSNAAHRHDVQRRWNEQERATYTHFSIYIEEVEPGRQGTPVNLAAAAADGADCDSGGLWNGWGPILADMSAHQQAMFAANEQGINAHLPSPPCSDDGSEEGGVAGVAAPTAAQLPPPRTAFEDSHRADIPKPNPTFSTLNFDDASSTTLGARQSSIGSKIAPIIAMAVCFGLMGLAIAMMAIGKLNVGAGVTIVALFLVCGAVKVFWHVLWSCGCRNGWVVAKRERDMANRNPASLV